MQNMKKQEWGKKKKIVKGNETWKRRTYDRQ